jgi:hypothetical protein
LARLLAVVLLGVSTLTAYGQQQPPSIERQSDEDISIQAFLQAVETAISTTDRAAWLNLLSPNADRDPAIEFYDSMVPSGVTRAVVRERDGAICSVRFPARGTASSPRSSSRPARAGASSPGNSTSAARVRPPSGSRGG